MKKVAVVLLTAGCLASIYATDARIIGMGKHDAFFMDETSVFRNPANLNYYPNMILGSLGVYVQDSMDQKAAQQAGGSTGNTFALQRYNRDPERPYFGAIVSYSLKQNAEAGNQYPMVSFGACFNRYDDALKYLSGPSVSGTNGHYLVMAPPTGKIDLMGGYAFPNGGMIGIGTYLAFQKEVSDGMINYQSDLFKGNIGMNLPLAKSMDLEASLGIMGV
ncbi:MAG: hypothetical protein PHC61_02445, partial [Chitinivibrionales bacterium]|nr:hypothetical protein [Chitinivibrionales bacterium]